MKCFVIMPFSKTTHNKDGNVVTIESKEWTYIFERWIKRAVESYPDKNIVCKRSGANPGNFIKGIVQDIYDSELVIADLTGKKPNVYYELGIRHALKLGTIMISQELAAVPSDLQSYYCFEYSYSDKNFEEEALFGHFEKEMHAKIKHVVSNLSATDSPVSDFLNLSHYNTEIAEKEEGLKAINVIIETITLFEEMENRLSKILDKKESSIDTNTPPVIFIQPSLVDALYISFLSSSLHKLGPVRSKAIAKILSNSVVMIHSLYDHWCFTKQHPNRNNLETFYVVLEETRKKLLQFVSMYKERGQIFKTKYERGEASLDDFFNSSPS
jgi:hypothetical protein